MTQTSYFYTSVEESRNKQDLLVRGYRNGKRFMRKVQYKPYLFVPTKEQTKYKTITGKSVKKIEFDSIKEAKNFVYEYKDVSNFDIYGQDKFSYLYIYDEFSGEIVFDPSLISVVSLDIETKTVSVNGKKGFPDIAKADHEVTAITIAKQGGKIYMFGLKDYTPENPRATYYKCKDEASLLASFIEIWDGEEMAPDIVTGWNIEFFDIPYLINRIAAVLGESVAKMMSPWRILDQYEVTSRGRTQMAFKPLGINVLDYLPLFKKFSFKNYESWTLDYIAQEVLGEAKEDYSEYDGLDDLYARNHQLYMKYNLKDVILVERLEEKMGFIALVQAFAYDAKVNYNDTMATVRPWDVIIHNFLLQRNIVIPQFRRKSQDRTIVGGFVKDPKPGRYRWVCSFDLNSLYPHLIMMYNISPDTYAGQMFDGLEVQDFLNGKLNDPEIRRYLEENNLTMTPNGALFRKDKQGFLAEIMQKMYDDRKVYQGEMKSKKKESAALKDKVMQEALAPIIARFHNLQLAKKIQLNAGYGAIANMFNRWFALEIAEAITTGGQLSIQWVERSINEFMNKVLETEGVDYVIAMDTDSAYISFDALVEKFYADKTDDEIVEILDQICSTKMQDVINKSFASLGEYTMAFDKEKMVMKRESIADTAIWTAKKRYIMSVRDLEGIRFEEPEIKVTGLEMVKSSTPGVCRKAMKEAIKLIVQGDESKLHDFVDDFYEKFKGMNFEQVAFPRGISEMDKWADAATIYKSGTPIHVKGALFYNHFLAKKGIDDVYPPIYNGDKVKFAYLLRNNPLNVSVISCTGQLPKEFDLETYIDRDTQFEKTFNDPMKMITDVVGWTTQKTHTLESFFE